MPYIQQNKDTIIKEYPPARDKYTAAGHMKKKWWNHLQ
jgi:hypothetical protein